MLRSRDSGQQMIYNAYYIYIFEGLIPSVESAVGVISTNRGQGAKPSLANFRRWSWSELQNYMEGRVSQRESEHQARWSSRAMIDTLPLWTWSIEVEEAYTSIQWQWTTDWYVTLVTYQWRKLDRNGVSYSFNFAETGQGSQSFVG